MSDTTITVIYHAMSMTVMYITKQNSWIKQLVTKHDN